MEVTHPSSSWPKSSEAAVSRHGGARAVPQ